jgi:endonuclease-3
MEKMVQTEKDAKRIFQRNFGMTYTCKLFGTEGNIPARGWDLDQDIITKTVGRKLSSTTT